MLVDHADAERPPGPGRVDADIAPTDPDLARVGLVQPRQDAHERRLAGPVLAEQAEHLARHGARLMRVVRDDAGEGLGDA